MQALQQKQIEAQKYRDIIANADGGIASKSIEERVEHCKNLQYVDHQKIFAVMYSTIHKAACDNSLAGMRYFLASGRKPKIHIDEYDKNGFCPIHLAAERGHNDTVNFCIDEGCDVNLPTTYGNTSLMLASKENQVATVSLLLEKNASCTARNKAGNTAVHFAAQGDHIAVITTLVEFNYAKELAAQAALAVELPSNSVEKLPSTFADETSSVISAGPSNALEAIGSQFETMNIGGSVLLNATNASLMTPLMTAAQFNSSNVVAYLISVNVPLDLVDNAGETALHKAGRKGCFPVYRALIAAGASEKIRNKFGETPKDLKVDNIDY
jgi:hypothetical protein